MGQALGCSCETSENQPEISLMQPVNKEGKRNYNADNNNDISDMGSPIDESNVGGNRPDSQLNQDNATAAAQADCGEVSLDLTHQNQEQSSLIIIPNQSPNGKADEMINIVESLDREDNQEQAHSHNHSQLDQVVEVIERQLSKSSSRKSLHKEDENLQQSSPRYLICNEEVVGQVAQQVILEVDEERAADNDEKRHNEDDEPQQQRSTNNNVVAQEVDEEMGDEEEDHALEQQPVDDNTWQEKFWDGYHDNNQLAEVSAIEAAAEEIQPQIELKVEEEEKKQHISPEQKQQEQTSSANKQSAQKRRIMAGGTKTPGHPTSTDFNQFSQQRKSAAVLVGQRKISATPSVNHQQLGFGQGATAQGPSRQMKNLQNNQFRAKTSMKKEDFTTMRGSFDQGAKPLQRRRLSAGKSKLPASLTPNMQSLNKTQQFISGLSKKASIAQPAATSNAAVVDESTEQLQNIQEPVIVEDAKEAQENIINHHEEEDIIMHDEEEKEEVVQQEEHAVVMEVNEEEDEEEEHKEQPQQQAEVAATQVATLVSVQWNEEIIIPAQDNSNLAQVVAEEIPTTTVVDCGLKNMGNHNEPSSVTPPTIEEQVHAEEVKKDTIISSAEEDQEKFIVHHIAETTTASIVPASNIESSNAKEEMKETQAEQPAVVVEVSETTFEEARSISSPDRQSSSHNNSSIGPGRASLLTKQEEEARKKKKNQKKRDKLKLKKKEQKQALREGAAKQEEAKEDNDEEDNEEDESEQQTTQAAQS